MSRFTLAAALLFSTIGCGSDSAPASSKHYRRVGGQGMVHFVVVDESHAEDEAVYREAISDLCAGNHNFCMVMFWTRPDLIPSDLPMTDEQLAGQVAHYIVNHNTGHTDFYFMDNGEPRE